MLTAVDDTHLRLMRQEAEIVSGHARHHRVDLDRLHLPPLFRPVLRDRTPAQPDQQHLPGPIKKIAHQIQRHHVPHLGPEIFRLDGGMDRPVDEQVAHRVLFEHPDLAIGTLAGEEHAGRFFGLEGLHHRTEGEQAEQNHRLRRKGPPFKDKDRHRAHDEQRRDGEGETVDSHGRDEPVGGEQGGDDARQGGEGGKRTGRAAQFLELPGFQLEGVGGHHAEQSEGRREKQQGCQKHRRAQSERGQGEQQRLFDQGHQHQPDPRRGRKPRQPAQGCAAVSPAPAEIIAAAQREQGDDDQGGPEIEADAVKGAEDAGAEEFDGEHRGARHRYEEVDQIFGHHCR